MSTEVGVALILVLLALEIAAAAYILWGLGYFIYHGIKRLRGK